MKLVIDASVAIKWIIRDPALEPDVDQALAILRGIRAGEAQTLVPVHWLAEVLAVIARARPQRIPITFSILRSFPFKEISTDATYNRAVALSIELDHHLFDTLYHAVALEHDAMLVTADGRYFERAERLGGIMLLANFDVRNCSGLV